MCKSPSSATINTTSAIIVAQNIYRIGLFIRNLDTTKTVYLAFGHQAEIGKGMVLMKLEAFSMEKNDYSTEAVYAIASENGVAVAIQEFDLGVV